VSGVLFVGAGREQRAAIVQARERGLHVVAADPDPHAPGLARADAFEVAEIGDLDAIEEIARRYAVDGLLTVALDGAVPVVAAVSERLGLPTIGSDVAHRFTHKLAMRRTLADEGVPQPAFAAVRTLAEGRAAIGTVGLPAVLKPVDAEGQRGLFRIEEPGGLESNLHVALAESRGHEAMLESYVDGTEMNAVVVARRGKPHLLTLSDRLRPAGPGFGVAVAHVHPARIHSDQLETAERIAERTVAALGLRDGVALTELVATADGGVTVLGAKACVPDGPLADLVRHAVGVDLVELALRFALGEEVPDELAAPQLSQPVAVRFLTASPGQLPTGLVTRVGALAPALSAPGVLQAETYLPEGTVVRPVRRAGDRHGYVLAIGATTVEALERADHAAGLVAVEVERRP
jgi:biotin carboxylase